MNYNKPDRYQTRDDASMITLLIFVEIITSFFVYPFFGLLGIPVWWAVQASPYILYKLILKSLYKKRGLI
jgi:hypothetical protein